MGLFSKIFDFCSPARSSFYEEEIPQPHSESYREVFQMIKRVDWASLHHAYGPANDVPSQLAGLTNPLEEVREHNFRELYGNIFHQGTRYRATPHTIPIFLKMLTITEQEDKADILELIIDLAFGYDALLFPRGFDVESYLKNNFSSPFEDEYCSSEAYTACVLEAQKGVDLFLNIVKSTTDEKVRERAIYALCWFSDENERLVTELMGLSVELYSAEAKAALALTLANLARSFENTLNVQSFIESLSCINFPAQVTVVKVAIFLLTHSEVSEAKLLSQSFEDGAVAPLDIRFNEGNVFTMVSASITSFSSCNEELIGVLSAMLQNSNYMESCDVVYALLNKVRKFEGRDFSEQNSQNLSACSVEAYAVIAEHSAYENSANYMEVVRGFGLPGCPEKLIDVMKEKGYPNFLELNSE